MFKKTADLVKEVTPNDCKLQTAKNLVPGILMCTVVEFCSVVGNAIQWVCSSSDVLDTGLY